MQEEYIEIVHVKGMLDLYRKLGPLQKATADRISELEQTVGVTYIEDLNLKIDPCLPKDTPIRIGGGNWSPCVNMRARNLRQLGYINVRADRQISFSGEDALRDAGYCKNTHYTF